MSGRTAVVGPCPPQAKVVAVRTGGSHVWATGRCYEVAVSKSSAGGDRRVGGRTLCLTRASWPTPKLNEVTQLQLCKTARVFWPAASHREGGTFFNIGSEGARNIVSGTLQEDTLELDGIAPSVGSTNARRTVRRRRARSLREDRPRDNHVARNTNQHARVKHQMACGKTKC